MKGIKDKSLAHKPVIIYSKGERSYIYSIYSKEERSLLDGGNGIGNVNKPAALTYRYRKGHTRADRDRQRQTGTDRDRLGPTGTDRDRQGQEGTDRDKEGHIGKGKNRDKPSRD